MRALAALALAGALAACTPADPAAHAEQQWQVCANGAIPEERLHACSVVIAAADVTPQRRAAALMERGVQRVDLGQHVRAVADFGRALRIDPTLVDAYLERGQIHFQRGAYAHAVADYDAALALQPGLELALRYREAALRGSAQMAESQLDTLSRQIADNPDNATLYNNRCWMRAVDGEQLDLALSDCDEALRLDPRMAAAFDSRGLVRMKRGEFAEALADYEAALALEPGRGHYIYGRGVARIRLGQEAAGRADLAAAERAEPGVANMYRSYGVTA